MCACTHTHTHTHTQCSHLREWPAMRVGLTGIKMLVVSQPSPRTASTSSANLPVQGLVLSLTGLETGSCQSPEDQDSGILTQSNTHRGLVSRPVVGVFICRESSECRVALSRLHVSGDSHGHGMWFHEWGVRAQGREERGMEEGEGKGGWERGVLGERPDGGANSAQAWPSSLPLHKALPLCPFSPYVGFQGWPSLLLRKSNSLQGLQAPHLAASVRRACHAPPAHCSPPVHTWRPPSSGRASGHHSTIRLCRTENGVLGLRVLACFPLLLQCWVSPNCKVPQPLPPEECFACRKLLPSHCSLAKHPKKGGLQWEKNKTMALRFPGIIQRKIMLSMEKKNLFIKEASLEFSTSFKPLWWFKSVFIFF